MDSAADQIEALRRQASGRFLSAARPGVFSAESPGLDLLDFPVLLFDETGYSTYTLRQASRRSWRIGQKHPIRVGFLTVLSS